MEAQVTRSPIVESYLQVFQKLGTELLSPVRKNAMDYFAENGFPTTRNEDWKYTNLLPLLKEPFLPALPGQFGVQKDVVPFTIPGLKVNQLVFVDGVYSAAHSTVADKNNQDLH